MLDRSSFDLFYFGSLIQRNAVSSATLKYILNNFSFRHIFYDVNLRKGGYDLNTIHHSLLNCTIFKLNNDEVPVIASMLFDKALDNQSFCESVRSIYSNVRTIVITASEKGCYVFDGDKLSYVPVRSVKVNDAVGAGDAFSAAFMHIYDQTGEASAAAKVANELGAFVTTQRGAIPEYSVEIRNLLNSGSRSFDGARMIL
jgi:fructokinase